MSSNPLTLLLLILLAGFLVVVGIGRFFSRKTRVSKHSQADILYLKKELNRLKGQSDRSVDDFKKKLEEYNRSKLTNKPPTDPDAG